MNLYSTKLKQLSCKERYHRHEYFIYFGICMSTLCKLFCGINLSWSLDCKQFITSNTVLSVEKIIYLVDVLVNLS